jgi:hypothetical protein
MENMNHLSASSATFPFGSNADTALKSRQGTASKGAALAPSYSDADWMLLTQASICCEEARHAAGRRRYRAACGLFSTAIMLYKRLLRENSSLHDPELRQQIAEQIQHITNERDVHSNLCSK